MTYWHWIAVGVGATVCVEAVALWVAFKVGLIPALVAASPPSEPRVEPDPEPPKAPAAAVTEVCVEQTCIRSRHLHWGPGNTVCRTYHDGWQTRELKGCFVKVPEGCTTDTKFTMVWAPGPHGQRPSLRIVSGAPPGFEDWQS